MTAAELEAALGPALTAAMTRKGYSELTPVQRAVLGPGLEGRDLRITSQTGSGKTLAIGFALRDCVQTAVGSLDAVQVAQPCALVVAPTRELALQMQAELQWLYADCGLRVVALTGGASYRDEHRALARSERPIVVGTPGRLLDHLDRGGVDPSRIGAVVLDEADRLLDMGFREDLERILKHAPEGHRTHLVSATFPRAVRALADRVQQDPAHVQGTQLGAANTDIEHVIQVVEAGQRLDAMVNLLLANPELQTLIFARTRADVAELASRLSDAGFPAAALSGELDQAARNRALASFRSGRQSVLVATDVAARGIDVQDIARVIHAEPPVSPVEYTHRAGRTGRAGRKGRSCLLVTPQQVSFAVRLLKAAEIPYRFEPVPGAAEVQRAIDERMFESLMAAGDEAEGRALERVLPLCRRLLESGDGERILARVLVRGVEHGGAAPREIRKVLLPSRTVQRPPAAGRDAGPPRGRARRPQPFGRRAAAGNGHAPPKRRAGGAR